MSSRKLFVILIAMVFMAGAVGSAGAVSSYVNSFSSTYPNSTTASFGCSICHVPAGPSARNAYGAAWASAGHNYRTVESQDSDVDGATNITEINAGTNPGNATSKPAHTPVECTGYTYSAWSACGANGQQTRTVTANTPAGCTGTPSTAAVLTQACTPPPAACTGYTYSAWSACGANGQQTRTVTANTPAGCTGTPSTAAALTQACTPPPTACTYTYSAWSACQSDNRQTRSMGSSSPAGCTGTPLLTQVCNYVPPAPTPTPTPTPAPTTNGTTLYMQHCSACHGSIERSRVRGESAPAIKEAISEVRKMSFLRSLTNSQLRDIANALVTATPPPPPPVPTGGVHPGKWLKQHPDFAEHNGASSCKTCHGQNLKGGTGPSCFSCHDNEDNDRNHRKDD